ncbi:hypothetical protein KMW28_20490 [Flammeovirga yaeyamensis]|uniref:Transporter n=1 Tax=Flammeovirga yaeyamensis TaxID=367791 RepID=A0AAX1N314_9BACT|nr:hypothetical protein [Flammeovirga yaeyamensis]MBB3700552.1 hypothetical protein [Flammeovirga yaeyamensis]NMF37669.1 hypothetical protein [Flammeovirga yaeyamensis]QWG01978.1 hypothetical protein KMW28_20490 [Flammeovirga yaeyamensis]
MKLNNILITSIFVFSSFLGYSQVAPTNADAEIAKKMQDPLAYISAIMSDNDLLFKTGENDFSFSSSIQPVKAWSFDKAGFNFIARGVIPILGLAPQAQTPVVGEPISNTTSPTWGLSDMITQFFFSPKTDGAWKWGIGPMFSLKTRTNEKLAGPGWGSGPVGVAVGGAGNFAFAFIAGHLWGFDEQFSTSIFQPMIFYNFPSKPGLSVAYNNQVSYNWSASENNELTLPLGLSVNRSWGMADGYGLELGVGPYWNVVKPEGSASFMTRLNVAVIFP